MPYNPRYYPSLLEGFGLKKVDGSLRLLAGSNLLFLVIDWSGSRNELTGKEPRLRVRPINLRHFDEELKIIKEIYNEAWSKNWGFVPLTEAEIDDLAKNLKPLVVPDLVLFAYLGEEPVGFSVSLPDYNEVLKHLNGKVGLLGYSQIPLLFEKDSHPPGDASGSETGLSKERGGRPSLS